MANAVATPQANALIFEPAVRRALRRARFPMD
jgi:hypothetical protein